MTTPYIGELALFAFGRIPNGWVACDGSLLPISQYDALFALIGTTYGGDGQTTFAVPDLRGRMPIHQGQGPGLSNHVIGERAGTETVTVLPNQMPAHTHALRAVSGEGTGTSPQGAVLASPTSGRLYMDDVPVTPLNPSSVGLAGGSQPHENMSPFLTLSYCIAVFGIFPSPA